MKLDDIRRSMMNDEITTISGSSLQLEHCKESYFTSFSISGKSKQAATTGAQLLNPSKMPSSRTVRGIAFTLNNDGTYTVSGTSTADYVNISIPYPLEPGSYYITGGSFSTVNIKVAVTHVNGTKTYNVNCPFVVLSSDTGITIVVQIEKAGTSVNEAIYPMLNAGSTAKPWEPYTGGQPSPSPEYPQPIISIGDGGSIEVTVTTDTQSQYINIPLVEPLRGLGEYQDRITYKSGEWGIERNIGMMDNSLWSLTGVYSGTLGHRYKCFVGNGVHKHNIPILCSLYSQKQCQSWKVEGDYISTDEMNCDPYNNINIRTLNHNFPSIEAFKMTMSNAVTIYPLESPTWEPLPEETQSALKSLHTYTHTTIISNSDNATMLVKYRKFTNK